MKSKIIDEKYKEYIEIIFKLQRFGIKPGFERINNILNFLGNPHKKLKCIHIAGTNGKGSIASYITSCLKELSFKPGMYSSPHLNDFRERIQINNQYIEKSSVVEFYNLTKEFINKETITFFEIATAMAFFEFAKQNVDFAVIETGMGGRLDATNVVNPIISIISNISFEHEKYLGKSLSSIAKDKAGIIKDKTPVVTSVSQKKAVQIIEDFAFKKKTEAYFLNKDFRYEKIQNNIFNYFGLNKNLNDLKISLNGDFQFKNTSVAIASLEVLEKRGFIKFEEKKIKKALILNKWRGRLEVISQKPLTIIDSAHNISSTIELCRFLKENYKNKKITIIFAVSSDKAYMPMLKMLLKTANKIIVTEAKNERALKIKEIEKAIEKIKAKTKINISDENIISSKNLKEAMNKASQDEMICICGSLFLIGDIER